MAVVSAPDAPLVQPLQLPQQLAAELRLSPEQFELVCQANPDAVLELSAEGRLIAMTPTGSDTSARNQTLNALLWLAIRSSARCQLRRRARCLANFVTRLIVTFALAPLSC